MGLRTGLRRLQSTVLILFLLVVSGCWDRNEVDRRAFVLGVAVDLAESNPEMDSIGFVPAEEAGPESGPLQTQDPWSQDAYVLTEGVEYLFTAEVPLLRALAGQEGGSGGEESAWLLSTVSSSMQGAMTSLNERVYRDLFLGHQRILLIGEEAARLGIKPILDYFERDNRVSRRTKVAVVKGEARKAFAIKPKLEQLSSIYLYQLIENAPNHSRGLNRSLNDALRKFHVSGDIVLPRITPGTDDVDSGGAAVFRDWRMVGWLGELETQGYMLGSGLASRGTITVPIPGYPSEELSFLYRTAQAEITTIIQNDRPLFTVDMNLEGSITEETGYLRLTEEQLIWAERAFAQEVTRRVQSSIAKFQQDFEIDAFDLVRVLQVQQPQFWKRYKSSWKEDYPTISIRVTSHVSIRRTGNT